MLMPTRACSWHWHKGATQHLIKILFLWCECREANLQLCLSAFAETLSPLLLLDFSSCLCRGHPACLLHPLMHWLCVWTWDYCLQLE